MLTIILYRLLFLPIFLLLAPYYAYRMKRRGGYSVDFKYRFGSFKKLPKRKYGKRRLWIQAVSVGEVKAIEKLIDILHKSGKYEIVLTTTTSTGYAIAKDLYKDKALFIGLFPFDFWLFSWRAWNKIFPHVAILVENEVWPEHIWQAHRRNVPVILINGRISDKTLSHYKILGHLADAVLHNITYALACDSISHDRLLQMGMPRDSVKTSGNIKFDNVAVGLSEDDKAELKKSLGFEKDSLVLLGSSTWEGEEAMLLKLLKHNKDLQNDWRLLLVPRHAERRDRLVKLLGTSGFTWHQRSTGVAKGPVQVCLADTTGELTKLTTLADVAFIGKSLSPNEGGQSPLEAAYNGVPIVYGDKMTNFKDICHTLEQGKCVIKVTNEDDARAALSALMRDKEKRETYSLRLKRWHKNNVGASEFTAKKIAEVAFSEA